MIFRHLRNVRGFFSDYYLGTVFGRGAGRGRRRSLADRETDREFDRLHRLYERAEGHCTAAADVRERLARPLLRDILGYHLGAGEDGVHGLFPSAETEARGERPISLGYIGGWTEDLDAAPAKGRRPGATLLTQALTRAGVRYGLLVTGSRLRLLRRPGDGPRGAYLELDIPGCLEDTDRESFAAAFRIFGAARFISRDDGSLPIDEDERESREHSQKVSDDLKRAIFQAAESLVHGFLDDWVSRDDQDQAGDPTLLSENDLFVFRDAALTTLYRLLFILYAEARDERLHAHALYRESYAVQTLVEELLTLEPERLPANRSSLWPRLLALFRIFDEGLPAMTLPPTNYERIPPRGSDFFSPATAPGQRIEAARLDDRTVGRLLLELTTTVPRQGVGRERVSFRELDIEQLGAVYEGLLEFEPRIARETTLELRVQGRTYALTPHEVVRLCQEKDLTLTGNAALVAGTAAETLHPELTPDVEDRDEEEGEEVEEIEEGMAEEDEQEESVRHGGTARLLRHLLPGQFYFAPGPARKGSGSFYTPKPLVDDLVRHALSPLVEGKSAAEIETLRILDPATGSAHFLVGAMRFLGQLLHAAYSQEFGPKGPPHFRGRWDSDHEASDEEARAANSEARAWCKRRIAERCLYGVDLNPTAVNLARVSLWIESLAGDRPLTYFEHHVRCGNSLLGTWLERLGDPPLPGMGHPVDARQLGLFVEPVKAAIQEAARKRLLIDHAADEGAVQPESLDELGYKEDRRRETEETLATARLLFDLRSASAFGLGEIWGEFQTILSLTSNLKELEAYCRARPWWTRFEEVCNRERFFHWELEYPEVLFDGTPGFDAVLGNPPWDKIKPDKKEFYGRYDVLIRAFVGGELDRRIGELQTLYPGLGSEVSEYQERVKTLAACLKKGNDYRFQDWEIDGKSTGGDPDVFKFFVERAHRLVRQDGRVGFVVPSAIYNNEGCTGLRHLLLDESEIERFYAFENRGKIFPIHSSYKFVSLVFRKGKPQADGFEAAFMRHELAELTNSDPKPWLVCVKRSELERLSPGTLAFLEYRSERDRKILLKMYERRPLLGDQGPGTWNAKFYTEFHMTNDRDLWTDPATGKLWTVKQILGFEPADFAETRARMAEAGFWPLYQDAHIHQYILEFKPLMRWVSLEAHQVKNGRHPDPASKLVVRDPARSTDERTCIAALLPEKSCFGHTLNGISIEDGLKEPLLALVNSICFDYLARKRIGGQHASPYLLERIAVPPPGLLHARLERVPQIHANEMKTWVYDQESYGDALWKIEKAVADAYGLTRDEVSFFLDDFPIFARKRQTFFTHLEKCLDDCGVSSAKCF